jgi:ABC-type nitrate/sulfonate/bicarbonate transport system permease component
MNFERLLIGGGTLVVFLLVWELCADFGAINPLFISSPSRIAQAGAALIRISGTTSGSAPESSSSVMSPRS